VFGAIIPIKESNHKPADVRLPAAMTELQDIRDSIDNIDGSIVHMLAERFRCTKKVGVLKAQHNLPRSDPEGAANHPSPSPCFAAKLDPEFSKTFLAFVIREVIRHHEAARALA
jgi:chorismate mutase